MKQINIDIETYSNTDLTKAGVYKYADDPSFSVLLFGYSVDQGPVRCIQCAKGEKIPAEIIAALFRTEVTEKAVKALGYEDWDDYLTKHGYLKWGYEPSFEAMESAWYHEWQDR